MSALVVVQSGAGMAGSDSSRFRTNYLGGLFGIRRYVARMRHALLLTLLIAFVSAPGSAHAQAGSPIAVQQIPSFRAVTSAGAATSVAAVHAANSPANAKEAVAVPAVSAATLEACRAAQVEDRAAPKGIDCIAAMQARAQAPQPPTAEGVLLQLLGQRADLTGAFSANVIGSTNADVAARQLATGDVQPDSVGGAAAVIARQRIAPTPASGH